MDAITVFVPGGFDLYLASMAPVDSAEPGLGGGGGGLQAEQGTPAKLAERASFLRMMRILRLVKLFRLVRASRLIERQLAKISVASGTLTIVKIVLAMAVFVHWYACIITLNVTLHTEADQTWVALFGFCHDGMSQELSQEPKSEAGMAAGTAPLAGCDSALSIGRWYLAAVSWSSQLITGTGGTGPYPNPNSDAETALVAVLNITSAFVWTYVLALFCDVVTNSDPALTLFRQRLDGLNLFIRVHGINSQFAQRLRRFMHQQKGVQLREDAKLALPQLSPALRVEIMMLVHRDWLDSIWFVKKLEDVVKVKLAMGMQSSVMAPGEVAPNRHLYLILRGTVIFGGRVLSRGRVWGDDVILRNELNFLPFLARAISYADLQYLSRERLLNVLEGHPSSLNIVRRCANFLALRRTLIRTAREMKISVMADGRVRMVGDFVEKLHEAAASSMSQEQEMSMSVALSLAGGEGTATAGGAGAAQSAGTLDDNLATEVREALSSMREEIRLLREQMAAHTGQGAG